MSQKPLEIVFFGTPQIAADVLTALASDNRFAIKLVVTGVAKPRGRHSLVPTIVADCAAKLGLPVFETDSPKDPALVDKINEVAPDFGIIVAWRILPEAVYAAPKRGTLNLHGSLLPKYRGAAPIQRSVWNGDQETGLTVFLLDRGVDTGKIVLSKTLPVSPKDTSGDLFQRFAPIGADLLIEALVGLAEERLVPMTQPLGEATPAPKIKQVERWIDWTQTAESIRRHIHALSPEPCATTKLGETRVLLYRVKEIDRSESANPGTILVDKRGCYVATGAGWLEIVEAAREGKRPLCGMEFARGIANWNGKQFQTNLDSI